MFLCRKQMMARKEEEASLIKNLDELLLNTSTNEGSIFDANLLLKKKLSK